MDHPLVLADMEKGAISLLKFTRCWGTLRAFWGPVTNYSCVCILFYIILSNDNYSVLNHMHWTGSIKAVKTPEKSFKTLNQFWWSITSMVKLVTLSVVSLQPPIEIKIYEQQVDLVSNPVYFVF